MKVSINCILKILKGSAPNVTSVYNKKLTGL